MRWESSSDALNFFCRFEKVTTLATFEKVPLDHTQA